MKQTNYRTKKAAHIFCLKGKACIIIEGSMFFWLDSRTLARVTETGKVQKLESIDVIVNESDCLSFADPSTIGTLPKGISADNFQFTQHGGFMVFSALVYPDYDLTTVAEQDKQYEERGTSAYVFDNTFVRHWDTWRGPKKSRLFSVELTKEDGWWHLGKWHLGKGWHLGSEFYRPLLDTEHVSFRTC